jgi:hypothetical protein
MGLVVALALLLGMAAVGCSKQEETAARAPGTSASGDTGAESSSGHAAGIVPGSYEDWCDEHQVQETMCTRCDASLIPAFKAAGDWDEKHGLPKSQCLKCDPTLKIVRPPKA